MPEDIHAIQTQIVKDFEAFSDWEDRYQYIMKLGKDLPEMDEALKTEKYRVSGCQSQVWMHASLQSDGLVRFQVASDALIVKGLIALLMKLYNLQTPQTILQTEPTFMEAIGMAEHLSMTRRNGLASMLKQIKLYATVLKMTQAI
jgi:cysteine desulfuration protein SufE